MTPARGALDGIAASIAAKDDPRRFERRLTVRVGAMVAGATAVPVAACAVFG